MARIEIGGIGIAYEILGDGDRPAVITPGGRFSKDAPGIRPLAEKLATEGMRVLIWDRPNSGESDICFEGESEAIQNADTLAGLLRALDFAPAYLIGGSAGSRDSLVTAIRHPDVVSRMFLLWISGGAIGLSSLPYAYCGEAAMAAVAGGMSAVAGLGGWKDVLERNPGNRDRLLGWDRDAFVAKMQHWAEAYFPGNGGPTAGAAPAELAALNLPVMILRSGLSDISHPRETSEAVQALIPGSRLAEPPWGDREFSDRLAGMATGGGLFENWPLLSKQILDFTLDK